MLPSFLYFQIHPEFTMTLPIPTFWTVMPCLFFIRMGLREMILHIRQLSYFELFLCCFVFAGTLDTVNNWSNFILFNLGKSQNSKPFGTLVIRVDFSQYVDCQTWLIEWVAVMRCKHRTNWEGCFNQLSSSCAEVRLFFNTAVIDIFSQKINNIRYQK